jgi:hypothetical protein
MDTSESTDYGSFQYQQGECRLAFLTTNGNTRGAAAFQFDPLASIGGLDNNEVAELVYASITVQPEIEDEDADQNVGTTFEIRGLFGANIDGFKGEELSPTGQDPADAEIYDLDNINEADVRALQKDVARDEVFETFRSVSSIPFDDEANGPGGGFGGIGVVKEKNWRDLTGRGPVLDNNDKLGILISQNTGDSIINVASNVRYHLVWDVAETSDAGRAFSVPMDD